MSPRNVTEVVIPRVLTMWPPKYDLKRDNAKRHVNMKEGTLQRPQP